MGKKGFPSFFFIAIFIIIALPKLAGFLPIIIFSWFVFRMLLGGKSSGHTKENPYRKRYEKKYGYQKKYDDEKNRDAYSEPKSYKPKNYSYSRHEDEEDLENPWQEKQEKKAAKKRQPHKEDIKYKYKPAPISRQEKQSFMLYFIPFLVGALTISIAMQMGLDKITALALGAFLAFILLVIMGGLRKKKRQKALSGTALIFEQGQQYVVQIAQIATQLDDNPSMQWEIQEIAHIVDRIYEGFREDATDIDRHRNFIKYNLPEAIKLMEGYAKVYGRSRQQNMSAENNAQLQKAEEAIITIRESFEKLQQDLLSNDLMDLEVQSRTIKGVLQNNLNFI